MDVGLVCDGCSAFNELGAATCARCQQGISLDGDVTTAQLTGTTLSGITKAAIENATPDKDCSMCGAVVAAGNRFCGSCGSPVDAPPPSAPEAQPAGRSEGSKRTLFFSSIQAAKAKLVLIKGEGIDGESYALAGAEHRIGSSDADIVFDEDQFLSPTHANFFYVAGKLLVRDEGSLNGTYLRIAGTRPLEFNNFFLVGEQVMQARPVSVDPTLRPREDGTYLYSSPTRAAKLELVQILHGGAEGLSLVAQNDSITLGREDNDINFPDDPFISGHHAKVELKGEELTLTDMGSKNGTFIRITKETPLEHGDYVFMGQQLLRVEIV
jgi:pSer/pThr/pTyr-binding forkhead associated (FHA) protein